MKNKRFLKAFAVLPLLLSFTASFAQVRYTSAIHHSTMPGTQNGYGCPVRYWRNDMSVAFVKQDPTNSAFCLIKHSDFSNIFPAAPPPVPNANVDAALISLPINTIDRDFTVNDIYIVDDYAFFCGTYYTANNVRKSFYGYFDINDMSTFNVNIHISTLDASAQSLPVTLSKLVAYQDGASYKVVAIGNEKQMLVDGHCMIVEIPDVFSLPNTCNTAIMPVSTTPVHPGYKLYVDDILLTSSYVVLLGHDIKTASAVTGYPWFAVCNKASVVPDVISITNNYFMPNISESNNTVEGVALQNDIFAMSYVHNENVTDYTRLRVIDIPTMQNTHSQQFKKPQKEDPVEMVYLKDLEAIELLQCVYDSSNFILLYPFFITNYTTSMLTPDGREYKSLSAIDGKRFISMRSEVAFLEDRTASLPHSTPYCPNDNSLDVEPIKELPPIQYPVQGNLGSVDIIYDIISPSNYIFPSIITNCHSYE